MIVLLMRLRGRKTKHVSPNALDDGDAGKLFLISFSSNEFVLCGGVWLVVEF